MPQNGTPVFIQNNGGNQSSLQCNAAKVIKATPGKIAKIIVQSVGAGGTLTINDNNAVGGSNSAANQILSLLTASLTAGQVIPLDFPCSTGITVSACSGGIVVSISYQ